MHISGEGLLIMLLVGLVAGWLANARMNLSRQRTVVRLRLDVPQRVLCIPNWCRLSLPKIISANNDCVVRRGLGWRGGFHIVVSVVAAAVCTENSIRIDWGGNHVTSAHNDRAVSRAQSRPAEPSSSANG